MMKRLLALACMTPLAIGSLLMSSGSLSATPRALSPNPGAFNFLNGVSAISPTNAWAIGNYTSSNGTTAHDLILHWNGATWVKVNDPNVATLEGVSAESGTDVWVVGAKSNSTTGVVETFILHWNGLTWVRFKSPNPSATYNFLNGVSADSASDAWAVGLYTNNTTGAQNSLTLHWNGVRWTKVASPHPVDSNLVDVSAQAANDAWAVGSYNGPGTKTLLLHWNGTSWTKFISPSPGAYINHLYGVSATSTSDAWAVGNYNDSISPTGLSYTLILHWNGTTWSKVASPNLYSDWLRDVSASSAGDVWAVGAYNNGNIATTATLILHWDGLSWSTMASPSVGTDSQLYGVSADSATNAQAVGDYYVNMGRKTLAAHWDGASWKET